MVSPCQMVYRPAWIGLYGLDGRRCGSAVDVSGLAWSCGGADGCCGKVSGLYLGLGSGMGLDLGLCLGLG